MISIMNPQMLSHRKRCTIRLSGEGITSRISSRVGLGALQRREAGVRASKNQRIDASVSSDLVTNRILNGMEFFSYLC